MRVSIVSDQPTLRTSGGSDVRSHSPPQVRPSLVGCSELSTTKSGGEDHRGSTNHVRRRSSVSTSDEMEHMRLSPKAQQDGMQRATSEDEANTSRNELLCQFLPCYLICTAADWMQGPYVYALYESYGYTHSENAFLFVAGFSASAVFGTGAGVAADRMGRRFACMLYCVLYIMASILKHFNYYEALVFGRILSGAATSLLCSAFDAWMVAEHARRNLDMTHVSKTFSTAVFCNSIVAIACGVVAQAGADAFQQVEVISTLKFFAGGYLVPFDMSLCLCAFAAVLMRSTWSENYGSRQEVRLVAGDAWSQRNDVCASLKLVFTDPAIGLVGLVSALFEASMYVFIFNWTPVLTESGFPKASYGMVFTMLMVGSMTGSQICSRLVASLSAHQIGMVTMITAAASHALLLIGGHFYVNLFAFFLFEVSVGMYFPSVGTVKAESVPDAYRATIYNIFRIPLNMIVVFTLCFHFSLTVCFLITTVCLSMCFVCMAYLSTRVQSRGDIVPQTDDDATI